MTDLDRSKEEQAALERIWNEDDTKRKKPEEFTCPVCEETFPDKLTNGSECSFCPVWYCWACQDEHEAEHEDGDD